MKSVHMDSDTPPVADDEEMDVLDPSVDIPLTSSILEAIEPSEIDVIDASNDDEMVTIEVFDGSTSNVQMHASLPHLRVNATGVVSHVGHQGKVFRRPRRRTQNALITISTLANDGPIESSINTLPIEIQIAFRAKLLGLFSLHLLALSLLVIIFTYSPLTTTSLEQFADNDTGIALGGTLMMALAALLVLYFSKFFFPFNLVLLAVFTCIQAICVTLMGLYFETKASVLICLICFFIMAFMTIFSTRRRMTRTGEEVLYHSLVACLVSYLFVMIISCIIFAAKGTGLMSATTFGLAMLFTFPIVMWFAFDAHCMYQIMEPDEYISGVIFFYTDLALFLVFVVVMILSIAVCDGGVPMACFGGSCGVNVDPIVDFPPPQPASADSPASPSPNVTIETI